MTLMLSLVDHVQSNLRNDLTAANETMPKSYLNWSFLDAIKKCSLQSENTI